MRKRRQHREFAPIAARLFKAHRSRSLIARFRETTEDRAAPTAQKRDRIAHPLRIAVRVDAEIAGRGAMTHLSVDARRKILVQREPAGADAKSQNARERAN